MGPFHTACHANRAQHQNYDMYLTHVKGGMVLQWSWGTLLFSTYCPEAFYVHGNLSLLMVGRFINIFNLLKFFFVIGHQ